MGEPIPNPQPDPAPDTKLKIYFLPNLLTRATCLWFVALTKIVEADLSTGDFGPIKIALGSSCWPASLTCSTAGWRAWAESKALSARVDSLADLVSFGVAPAFLFTGVMKDVFGSHAEWAGSWLRVFNLRRFPPGEV